MAAAASLRSAKRASVIAVVQAHIKLSVFVTESDLSRVAPVLEEGHMTFFSLGKIDPGYASYLTDGYVSLMVVM